MPKYLKAGGSAGDFGEPARDRDRDGGLRTQGIAAGEYMGKPRPARRKVTPTHMDSLRVSFLLWLVGWHSPPINTHRLEELDKGSGQDNPLQTNS